MGYCDYCKQTTQGTGPCVNCGSMLYSAMANFVYGERSGGVMQCQFVLTDKYLLVRNVSKGEMGSNVGLAAFGLLGAAISTAVDSSRKKTYAFYDLSEIDKVIYPYNAISLKKNAALKFVNKDGSSFILNLCHNGLFCEKIAREFSTYVTKAGLTVEKGSGNYGAVLCEKPFVDKNTFCKRVSASAGKFVALTDNQFVAEPIMALQVEGNNSQAFAQPPKKPEPVNVVPQPVIQPEPVIVAPQPVVQPEPVIVAPQPVVQPEPVNVVPQPVVQPEPVNVAPQPPLKPEPMNVVPQPPVPKVPENTQTPIPVQRTVVKPIRKVVGKPVNKTVITSANKPKQESLVEQPLVENIQQEVADVVQPQDIPEVQITQQSVDVAPAQEVMPVENTVREFITPTPSQEIPKVQNTQQAFEVNPVVEVPSVQAAPKVTPVRTQPIIPPAFLNNQNFIPQMNDIDDEVTIPMPAQDVAVKVCSHCNAAVGENDKFCYSCGYLLD